MSGFFGTEAGIPSDLNLLLQIIVIITILVGVKYGKEKTQNSLKKHRRITAVAVMLNAVGLLLVMGPSIVGYFSTPLGELSPFGIVTTSFHAVLGGIAEVLGIAFVLNMKPKNVRLWMRLTRLLWVIAFVLGVSLYLQVAGLI
jgi:uncharacterized membrane protein YozB (DUF420 family)